MTQLHCSVGDLAITVGCNYPENLGKIVHVLKPVGYQHWAHIDDLIFTWEVVVAGENSWLLYEVDGALITKKAGFIPDVYLRRITPPKSKKQALHDASQQGVLDLGFEDQKEYSKIKLPHVLPFILEMNRNSD